MVLCVFDVEMVFGFYCIVWDYGFILYMVFFVVYNMLFVCLSGQEDIIVGLLIVGCLYKDFELIFGMFVNMFVIRMELKVDKWFIDYLVEVCQVVFEVYEYQDYLFEEFVEWFGVQCDISCNLLFDVMFVVQNMEYVELLLDDLYIQFVDMFCLVFKFDFILQVFEGGGQIYFLFEYVLVLF